jgi:hypothetical protein
VDTTELSQAFDDFLLVAEEGGFGPPPQGEWDANRVLAHVHAVNAHIAATALAVHAGLRVTYDNRPTLDEWNLRRLVAGGDLVGRVRRGGEMYRAVVEQLDDADLEVPVAIFIVSNDEIVVDEALPLLWLVAGVGEIHLPRHAMQLADLRG